MTIGNAGVVLGYGVFSGCDSLPYARIGSGAMLLRRGSCDGSITIQPTIDGLPVTHLGEKLFSGCSSLTNVTIPDSVTSIGDYAFEGCASLTSVSIPDSVTSIGNNAFYYCSGLTSIMIPDSVTSIRNGAFWGCTSLTNITIPNSVTSIGDGAFYHCPSLATAYFEGNAPSVEWDIFYEANNATIYYLPGTIGWGPAFSGRPTALWVLPQPVILTASGFGVRPGGYSFRISWATNVPVVVEASTTLANPVWSPVSTNTLTEGWSDFTDLEWTNHPSRFYRVRSP